MASIVRPTLLRQTALASRWAAAPAAFAKPSFQTKLMGVAGFHNTVRRTALIPPGPQRIVGTVNDPAPVPEPSASHGSYHWSFERLLAVGLVPLTVAPFASGSLNPTTDAILCAVLLLHSHLGFQQSITDYFPKYKVPNLRRLMDWILNLATVLVGVGLYEFETNDVGITEAVKRVWRAA